MVSQLVILKCPKLIQTLNVQVLLGFLLHCLRSRVDSLDYSYIKECIITIIVSFFILQVAILRDIRMIEGSLYPIIGRCLLVGPDSMELHRKRADCLLHRTYNCFLLVILFLDIFKLLRQLAHFDSQFLLPITVCLHDILLFLILLLVKVFFVLCFEHLQLHLGHFLFEFLEVLHKLCLEDLLLFHLLFELTLKLLDFIFILSRPRGYGRPLRCQLG